MSKFGCKIRFKISKEETFRRDSVETTAKSLN